MNGEKLKDDVVIYINSMFQERIHDLQLSMDRHIAADDKNKLQAAFEGYVHAKKMEQKFQKGAGSNG